jgi:hypothetical protein
MTIPSAPMSPPSEASARLESLKSLARREESIQARRSAEAQAIEFYGVIQDQNSNTIPNVRVEYIIYPTPPWPDRGRGEVISDTLGRFSITGHQGSSISFNLIKSGYRAADPHLGASFSLLVPSTERYIPDSTKPRVLRMWKEKGTEELIGFQETFSCPLPDGAINIDIISGEIVKSGGDLRLEASCGPKNPTSQSFDWRCLIEPIDGGVLIVKSLEQFDTTFEAPPEGYVNQVEVKMGQDDPKWQAGFSRLIFLKSKGGQIFAKFNLMVSLKSDKAYISLYRGLANPNGSRNFEVSSNNVKEVFR